MARSVSIETIVARSKRAVVAAPSPAPIHKGWGEPVNEREFVKGLATDIIRFSNRRDYVGLVIVAKCPYNSRVRYTFEVMEREGVRTLVFIKSRTGYGHVLRSLKLKDREKINSLTSTITNFLSGEPLCATLKKLQSAFLPASSQRVE